MTWEKEEKNNNGVCHFSFIFKKKEIIQKKKGKRRIKKSSLAIRPVESGNSFQSQYK